MLGFFILFSFSLKCAIKIEIVKHFVYNLNCILNEIIERLSKMLSGNEKEI